MTQDNPQSPVSALLMLEGLAWALERLPTAALSRDRGLRADLANAARDAARATVEQHEEWSLEQLVRARGYSSGEWGREILRVLRGVTPDPTRPGATRY